MKVFFRQQSDRHDLRAQMLETSLRGLFNKNARTNVDEGAAEMTQSRLFCDLPAFAPGPGSTVFVGLSNLPQEMMGRNSLVCTRPLAAELEDFARRNALDRADAAHWTPALLRNFDAAIFTDIATFNASKGFAPWLRLLVAPNFPVQIQRAAETSDEVRIAVILHGKTPADEALEDRLGEFGKVETLSADTDAQAGGRTLSDAAVHIHVGYTYPGSVAGMSPFDSAMSRKYCVIMSQEPDPRVQFGAYLTKVLRARSYCAIAQSPASAAAACETMIDRMDVMARNDFRINPELAAYAHGNETQRNKSLRRFWRLIENA